VILDICDSFNCNNSYLVNNMESMTTYILLHKSCIFLEDSDYYNLNYLLNKMDVFFLIGRKGE